MKRLVRILCTGTLFRVLALAAPVDCTSGTLQDYINLSFDGCTLEDKTILDFTLLSVSTGATPISPAAILVTPLPTPLQPGFRFDVNAAAGAGEFLQAVFGFTVLAPAGANPIGGVGASMAGSAAFTDGAVTVVNDFCLGESFSFDFCGRATDNLILFDIGSDALLADFRTFSPLTTLGVNSDIGVDGGLSGGAQLSSFTIRFNEVPEPGSLLLVSAGVAALTLKLRHRRR